MELLYKNKSNDNYIKKYFLFGVFYYKKNLKTFEEEIRILGLPLWKKKLNRALKNYIIGVCYYKRSSRKLLYSTILNQIDNKYEHIYINFNCSGETYLFLAYLNPPQNSVFIATKKYHIDLCHMLHPETDCIYLPNIINLRSFDSVYKENFAKKTFYNVLPFKHFVNLEKKLQAGEDIHYCKEICNTMGIKYSTKAKLPNISEEIKISTINKVKRINLNLDNFIFIAPESQSNKDPKEDFWQDIIEKSYKEGVDVFLNIMQLNPKYGTAKTCYLTFEEGYYLASLSKKIIGLRSGFIEPLTSIQKIPVTCYYTDFEDRGLLKHISSEKVLKGFSLKELPNVNIELIKEFDLNRNSKFE